VGATASVSLGLIVTELVINALKHAFPGQRPGRIAVTYRSDGGKWSLLVSDDGIGMPTAEHEGRPGLGTGIVEALARQLGGDIEVHDGSPGTVVSVVHDDVVTIGVTPLAAE
jgi:two-component sensor histidine kinase